MPGQLRVLWVSPEAPNRAKGGGNIRQSYLIEHLAAHLRVDLLLAGDPCVDDQVARCVSRLDVVPLQSTRIRRNQPTSAAGRKLRSFHDAVLPGGPLERRNMRTARLALAGALRHRGDVDCIMIEHTGLAPLVSMRRRSEAWLLTMQNVPSLSAAQAAEVASTARQEWILKREIASGRSLEARALRDFNAVISMGAEDAAALPGRSVVVPNGVDLNRYGPVPLSDEPRLVFTGSLSYQPNVDGMEWFCHEIFPAIRRAVPAAELSIVGRSPSAEVLALASLPGVFVHVDVPDVRPYLDAAQLAVVPLRFGSGTRLKALEALARGRPVVGTTIGLAGLGLENSGAALVRDDPTEMAAAIIDLLGEPLRSKEFAGRAPAVAARFSWERSGELLLAAVERAVGHH